MKKRTCLILALLVYCFILRAQTITFNHLGTENGLSQFSVYALYEDVYGRIWMGTRNGLNVYNGNDFKVYKADPDDEKSFSGKSILQICGKKEKLSTSTVTGHRMPVLAEHGSHSIAYHQGTLYIGEFGAIYAYDTQSKTVKLFFQSKDKSFFFSRLLVDSDGNIWAGSSDRGLYKFTKGGKLQAHY